MSTDPRLLRLLGSPDLAGLRKRLRRRLERTDGLPEVIRLSNLLVHERAALAALTGAATRTSSSLALDIGTVGRALAAAGLAASLRDALEQLDGPFVDRAAVLKHRLEWQSLAAGLRHGALAAWLESASNLGLLRRHAGGELGLASAILERTQRVLDRLPGRGVTRSQLAASVLGDAHALDNGRPEASLVLSVLRHARRATEEEPETDEDRRETWALAGVMVNELARPALFLNLPIRGESSKVAADGEPAFASLRRLLRERPAWDVRGRDVFVCENPNIVAIAADGLGKRCAPLVCTDGMPAAAQRTLLLQLAEDGARLRYHGDFDWPGIRIANLVIREHSARPWLMSADDYSAAIAAVATRMPLVGPDTEAIWDAHLSGRMRLLDVSVAEEALSDALLFDLGNGSPSGQT